VHFRQAGVVCDRAEVVKALSQLVSVFVGEGLVPAVPLELQARVGIGVQGVLDGCYPGVECGTRERWATLA